jgi:hypothetical protein
LFLLFLTSVPYQLMITSVESVPGVECLKLVSFSIPDHAIQEMIISSHE